MPVFELGVNTLLLTEQFFDGRKLQWSFIRSCWVIAQVLEELSDGLLLVWENARQLRVGWVAIKQDKESDLLALELKTSCQRVGNESAERPAKQMIRSGRLNCVNLIKVIGDHFLKGLGYYLGLVEATGLQSIDREIRSDILQKSRVTPAEAARWMDAEERWEASMGPKREDDIQ